MNFALEPYSRELFDEMRPLLALHFAETSSGNYGPLEPNLDFYEQASWKQMIRIYTIRQTDEVSGMSILMGYQIFFIVEDPHSRGSSQAVQDILYLTPSARKGLTGYKFIKWCVDMLRKSGVDVVHQRIGARYDFGPLFERLGFQLEDLTYSMRLKEVA